VARLLLGRIRVLRGLSGYGKSTLLNIGGGTAVVTFMLLKDTFLVNNAPAIQCVGGANVYAANCTFSDNNPLITRTDSRFVGSFGNTMVVGGNNGDGFTGNSTFR
jgi:hypothetical protein